jgi:uncharacterized damage-inducible protein DinB
MRPEFEHEIANTRLLLDRVPAGHAVWKPHPKFMALGELASHLADIPVWVQPTLQADSLHTPRLKARLIGSPFASREEVVKRFDRNVSLARDAISGTDDARLTAPWSLRRAGRTVFTMPRVAVLRTFLLNHMIHHRGQPTVYLRLKDVPLPGINGPTADER